MAGASELENKDIRALIDQALAGDREKFVAAPEIATVIRSVSAKQRPRRPVAKAGKG